MCFTVRLRLGFFFFTFSSPFILQPPCTLGPGTFCRRVSCTSSCNIPFARATQTSRARFARGHRERTCHFDSLAPKLRSLHSLFDVAGKPFRRGYTCFLDYDRSTKVKLGSYSPHIRSSSPQFPLRCGLCSNVGQCLICCEFCFGNSERSLTSFTHPRASSTFPNLRKQPSCPGFSTGQLSRRENS